MELPFLSIYISPYKEDGNILSLYSLTVKSRDSGMCLGSNSSTATCHLSICGHIITSLCLSVFICMIGMAFLKGWFWGLSELYSKHLRLYTCCVVSSSFSIPSLGLTDIQLFISIYNQGWRCYWPQHLLLSLVPSIWILNIVMDPNQSTRMKTIFKSHYL